jgi:hypothetical protein
MDIETDFGAGKTMIKKIIQTKNPIFRLLGNVAGYLGNWLYSIADKYGDVYDFSDLLSTIEDIDSTGVWQGDE